MSNLSLRGRPAPLQTAPGEQEASQSSQSTHAPAGLSHSLVTGVYADGGGSTRTHHFLRVTHKLHFAESRVDLLHAVRSLPRPHVYGVLQWPRQHPNSQVRHLEQSAAVKRFNVMVSLPLQFFIFPAGGRLGFRNSLHEVDQFLHQQSGVGKKKSVYYFQFHFHCLFSKHKS